MEENQDLQKIIVSETERKNATIGWGLYLLGLFTGIFYIVAFVWAVVGQKSDSSTFEKTHYRKMKSMFIWSCLWFSIGFITSFILIGFFILLVLYIWNIYVIVVGLKNASDSKNYPI